MITSSRIQRLVVGIVMVAGLAGGTAVSTSDRAWGAAAAMLADPMSVLAGRSPGTRPDGALTQTKPMRVASLDRADLPPAVPPFVPSERVLPLERVRPGLSGLSGFVPPVDFAGVPVGGPGGFLGGPEDNGFPGGGGGFIPIGDVLPGGGGGVVGGGGGGGGLLPVPGTVIPPTGSVPEPAAWAMMIAGVFTIGGVLRRRRRRGSLVGSGSALPR